MPVNKKDLKLFSLRQKGRMLCMTWRILSLFHHATYHHFLPEHITYKPTPTSMPKNNKAGLKMLTVFRIKCHWMVAHRAWLSSYSMHHLSQLKREGTKYQLAGCCLRYEARQRLLGPRQHSNEGLNEGKYEGASDT